MANNNRIPAIPTRNVRFEEETLQFDILAGCAYSHSTGCFFGGRWVNAHIKTRENEPVWVKLDGGELVIEKLINSMIDTSTGIPVGGEIVEIARFSICQ